MKKIMQIALWMFVFLGIFINLTFAIDLSTNRKSPSTSQYVNLTIETDDDYTGKLTFSAMDFYFQLNFFYLFLWLFWWLG